MVWPGDDWRMDRAGGGAMRTLAVAASDSLATTQAGADYVCDGTADEVEINAAIAALPAAGGCVWLSEGQFNLAAPITDQAADDVSLIGMGTGTVLYITDGADVNAIRFMAGARDHWVFANFKIDGNNANQTTPTGGQAMIYAGGLTDSLIDNIEIVDSYGAAIRLEAPERVTTKDCRFSGCRDGGWRILFAAAEDNLLLHTYFADCTNDPFIDIGNGPQATVVRGCYLDLASTGSTGINVQGGIGTNIVEDTILEGNEIRCDDQNSVGIYITSSYVFGIQVLGNILNGCNFGVWSDSYYATIADNFFTGNVIGIRLERADSVVDGNFLSEQGTAGMDIRSGSAYNVVTNNTVRNTASGDGIRLRGDNNLVQSNFCYDDDGTPTQVYGIQIYAGADNNQVMDNYLIGNDTAGMVDAGAGNMVRNNWGYVTENSGTSSILNASTSIVVAHGLDVTPTVDDISITLAEQGDNDPGNIWVDTIGAANFTVNCRNDPGASNLDFGWQVIIL